MPRPSTSHLSSRLRQLTTSSPPATALFYARIWYALSAPFDGDHEALHVLALCFLQCDQPYSALYLVRDLADAEPELVPSRPGSSGFGRRKGCYGCAMIVGKCCDRLSRYSEGKGVVERALASSTPMNLPSLSPSLSAATPHLMLARLSHKGKAPEQAVEAYTKALQEDPWLWEAFTGLCDIGESFPSGPN
ncbi:hypothetical protein BD324DRAFT_455414 [Kockovaella imperatae]|uniref:Uncharacterized protein n=1 Tax=Kockovaella imperatae TaxID=4999 RepID=A0A1Y1UEW3_9TREE|nr:hypothetical protein BD324DRAFT_455414 [Kockovaella imperatae]ORX36600.1 hypothetical protein BD324DRAFT_455414 [Kockovaella imperatae]